MLQAAWGGGMLMSEQYKNSYRFDGINRADSVTWNPHKLMSVLLQCSTVHFKENVRLSSIEKKRAPDWPPYRPIRSTFSCQSGAMIHYGKQYGP